MVAQETEKYESEVKKLRSQTEKLTADLKYTKVSTCTINV